MIFEEPLQIESKIFEVTVYRRNALVSRKVELPSTVPESIKISGLPLSLDDSSIQIRIASSDTLLSATDIRVILEVLTPDKELPAPDNKKLVKLSQMRIKIDSQIQMVNKLLSRTNSIAFQSRGIPADTLVPNTAPVDSRKMLLEFSLDRKHKLLNRLRDLRIKINGIDRDIDILADEFSRESTNRQNRENELRKSVIINFNSSGKIGEKAELFLEYLIPGARWFPVYKLDISSDYSKYLLTLRAMIQQHTGEDWNNIQINLSTAEAVRWMELPKLSSRIFGRPKPVLPSSGWRKAAEGASVLFSDYDKFINKFPQKKIGNIVKVNSASGDMEFDADNVFGAGDEPYEENDGDYEKEMDMEEEMPIVSYSPEIQSPKMSKKLRVSAPVMRKDKISMESLSIPKGMPEELLVDSDDYLPGTELLEYNKMRMDSAESATRGKLKKVPAHKLYQVSGSKADIVYQSIDTALECTSGSVPVNCSKPESYDGFDFSFKTDSNIDIPSDGSYHIRSLSSYKSTGKMHYISVPRESSDVYRFIQFTNPLDAPALTGPIDISIGSDYILTSQIDTVPPGGVLKLGLGVEEGIKISRNTFFNEETTGLIKGSLGLNHTIDIVVQNNLRTSAEIEIRERISVPPDNKSEKDEKVKVLILELKPEWEEYDQDPNLINGAYRWKASVSPGGKSRFHVQYEIRIPSQFEIVGGNRREN